MSAARALPALPRAVEWQDLSWTADQAISGWPEDMAVMSVRYIANSWDPDTLVFNSLGGKVEHLEETIYHLGKHGLSAAGLDLSYLPGDTPQELTNEALLRSVLAAADDIDMRSGNPRPRNYVGSSKGGAEALLFPGLLLISPELRGDLHKKVRSVAAINTIGVANKGLGNNPPKAAEPEAEDDTAEKEDPLYDRPRTYKAETKARKLEFLRRMTANIMYEEPTIQRVARGESARVEKTVMFEKGVPLVKALVNSGLRVRMFSGKEDIVAPTAELLDELGPDYAHIVERVAGHHASLGNDVGKQQVLTAAEWAVSHDDNRLGLARNARRLMFQAGVAHPALAAKLGKHQITEAR